MTQARLGVIHKEIVRIAREQQQKDLADRELLAAFVAERDETAFAVLVKRHGPMVLRVCERTLRHRQDAEDAFQATFLLLARKASSIRKPAALASWLHGVAYRMAQNAKRAAARRRGHESRTAKPATTAAPDPSWNNVQAILDAEIERLPEKYRTAFVLCHLQGQDRAKVAGQLGLKARTLSNRLTKARELLQGRLAQQGISLSALLAAFTLGSDAVARSVPPALTAATTAAAVKFSAGVSLRQLASAAVATLTEKAMRAMMMTRIMTVTLALFISAGVVGVGHLAYQAAAGQVADAVVDEKPAAVAVADDLPKKPSEGLDAKKENLVRTDADGDPLPPGARMRLGTARLRHPWNVSRVVFTPDGERIVSASGHSVHVWEKATGKRVRQFDATNLLDLAVSADGKMLALAQNGTLEILNLATGDRKISPSVGTFCVAISPDRKLLASGGISSSSESVDLWDTATGKKLRILPGKMRRIGSLAFSPDGKSLAAAGGHLYGFAIPDGSKTEIVRVWDVASGHLHFLDGHTGGVTAVAYAPDGKILATASHDGTICFWDPYQKTKLRKIQVVEEPYFYESGMYEGKGNGKDRGGVLALAYSPDGRMLASAQYDGTVRLWDANNGKQLRILRSQWERVQTVAFSPDGKVIAGGVGSVIRLWETATGKLLGNRQGHEAGIIGFGIFQNGNQAASAASDRSVRLWDLTTGREASVISGFKNIRSFALSPDGEVLAVGEEDGTIHLHNVKGREIQRLRGHTEAVNSACFSPDGKLLASASNLFFSRDNAERGSIRIWEMSTGREIRKISDVGNVEYYCLRFSPDGKWLGAYAWRRGGQSGVEVWEAATGRKRHHFPKLNVFAFLPDGKRIVGLSPQANTFPMAFPSAGNPTTVHFVNLVDGGELYSFRGPNQSSTLVNPFVPSPDGRLLAIRNNSERGYLQKDIELWELTTGKLRRTLKGHVSGVTQLVFTPDGRSLVSASQDTTMLVWDVARHLEQEPRRLTNEDLAMLWRDLGADNAERADKAIWQLVAAPQQSLPFLRKAMPPVAPPESARLGGLVVDLSSDKFATRDKANRDLESLGDLAEPALRKALAGSPTLELRLRIERLLDRLKPPVTAAERIREIRAVEVLEHIGNAAAKQMLRTFSQGAPGAWLTKEAQASLQRLGR